MGEVWQGHDRTIARTVAVKLMPLDTDDRRGADQFMREARTAGALRHPGVVTVHDGGVDEAEGCLFLVMEHVEGRDLAGILKESGPRAVSEALDWAEQVADTLDTAHAAGIVHRDLKPGNLMRTERGRIVVLDFGIARFVESATRSSRVMGTLGYMAPERFDELPGDARTDLYALGCILTELLTGALPFEVSGPIAMMKAHLHQVPEPLSRRREGIPPALDELVLRLLAKDPDDRPGSAWEVKQRLRAVAAPAAGGPVPAPPAATLAAPASSPIAAAAPNVSAAAPTLVVPTSAHAETSHNVRIARRRILTAAVGATALIGAGTATALHFTGGSGSPTTQNTPPPRLKWQARTGPVAGRPTVADDVVYAGSTDGNLYALDAVSGATKWSFRTADRIMTTAAVGSVLVYTASMDGLLYALDKTDGTQKWTYDTGFQYSASSPVLADGGLHFVSPNGTLYTLDDAYGQIEWSARLGDAVQSEVPAPAITGDTLCAVGTDLHLHAFKTGSGDPLWGADGSTFRNTPSIVAGVVYAADTGGTLHALDQFTGNDQWKCATVPLFGTDGGARRSVGSPFVDMRPRVYLIADTPCAIDRGKGTVLWQDKNTGDGAFAESLVLIGSTLYACAGNSLHAFDSAEGTAKWSYSVGDSAATSVTAIDENTLLVTGSEGGIWALTLSEAS
jgi:serine/threonine-protein kinase